ncbi:MAG: ferredoxin--NADP reductase [Rhodocyclaceae bacterium]|nr:ferredoxin--NADP reductase [Rhodocyclaceae bacterium]
MGWIEGRVAARRAWTETHISLGIEADLPVFEPGQFVRLGLDIDGETVGRPYSLVNPPGAGLLEVYFDVVPGGPLSPRLAALAPGDRLRVGSAPYGFMVLSELPEGRDLWLLATGTGVGPFVSILESQAAWGRFENLRLVHGVRRASELAYRDRLLAMEERHGGRFRYLPFVTREACDFALPGRIPAAIGDGRLAAWAGLPLDPRHARLMLCGNPGMVAGALEALAPAGFRRHRRREPGQILLEEYWSEDRAG